MQGRFYSTVLDEKYLYHAIKYVENNPYKARLVRKREDWEYSSAKANIEGKDQYEIIDKVKVKEYIKVGDWKKYLEGKEDEEVIKEIRMKTTTERPLGSEGFIKKLEREFGRRLRAFAEGRPKKTENNQQN
jgi:putative transposase